MNTISADIVQLRIPYYVHKFNNQRTAHQSIEKQFFMHKDKVCNNREREKLDRQAEQ